MQLSSEAVTEGGTIDIAQVEPTCGGRNVSPDLTWSDAPEATKSFAITCFDPDAPTGSGWWHWIAIDLPAHLTSLSAGQGPDASYRQWGNDFGYPGYGGPCPPPGPAHRYVFTVHALDVEKLDVPDEATSAVCRFNLFAHELDSASITATFGLPQ